MELTNLSLETGCLSILVYKFLSSIGQSTAIIKLLLRRNRRLKNGQSNEAFSLSNKNTMYIYGHKVYSKYNLHDNNQQ